MASLLNRCIAIIYYLLYNSYFVDYVVVLLFMRLNAIIHCCIFYYLYNEDCNCLVSQLI